MFCYAEQITKTDGFFGRVAQKTNTQRLSGSGDGGTLGDGKPRQKDQDGAWCICRESYKRPVWHKCTVTGRVVPVEVRMGGPAGLRRSLGCMLTAVDTTEGLERRVT